MWSSTQPRLANWSAYTEAIATRIAPQTGCDAARCNNSASVYRYLCLRRGHNESARALGGAQWRWEAPDSPTQINPAAFARLLRQSTVHFSGDSITLEIYAAVVGLMHEELDPVRHGRWPAEPSPFGEQSIFAVMRGGGELWWHPADLTLVEGGTHTSASRRLLTRKLSAMGRGSVLVLSCKCCCTDMILLFARWLCDPCAPACSACSCALLQMAMWPIAHSHDHVLRICRRSCSPLV